MNTFSVLTVRCEINLLFRVYSHAEGNNAEFDISLFLGSTKCWTNSRFISDSRCHDAHVMSLQWYSHIQNTVWGKSAYIHSKQQFHPCPRRHVIGCHCIFEFGPLLPKSFSFWKILPFYRGAPQILWCCVEISKLTDDQTPYTSTLLDRAWNYSVVTKVVH